MTTRALFENLATVRRLLVSSPLVSSLETALPSLARAVDALRTSEALTESERERLGREVAAIGLLLNGFGLWLSSRGALTSTYNRHAEFDCLPLTGSGLAVEG